MDSTNDIRHTELRVEILGKSLQYDIGTLISDGSVNTLEVIHIDTSDRRKIVPSHFVGTPSE
jgi:hypothetical protein